jgi:DHA3 family macrolide efflux protein-like MFS transporter
VSAPPPEALPPARLPLLLRPLAARPVRLLWGGLTLSAMGDQLYAVALVWVAVGVFGPAAGYLSALQAGCAMLAALLVGRWADDWEQRRAMAAADLLRAGVLLGLVVWWLGRGSPPPAGLALAIVVLAGAEAVFRPALAQTLPTLLPDARLLPAANALFDTTERSARLIGPGLVGVLAGVLPVVHFFTLDAVSFLLSATAVLSLGRVGLRVVRPRLPLLAGIGHSFAVVRGHRLLWTVLLCSGPINGLWIAAFYLALPLQIAGAGIAGPGGTGLGAFGLVISAYGCTNLMATLVIGSRPLPAHPGRMMFTGSIIVGLGTAALAFGAIGGLGAMMAAAAFAAVGGPMKDIPVAVLRQTELPPGDVAAAMRAFMVASSGGVLVAMPLAPWAIDRIGPGAVAGLCGTLLVSLACAGLARHWSDGRTGY